jgi:hypothetical protein
MGKRVSKKNQKPKPSATTNCGCGCLPASKK